MSAHATPTAEAAGFLREASLRLLTVKQALVWLTKKYSLYRTYVNIKTQIIMKKFIILILAVLLPAGAYAADTDSGSPPLTKKEQRRTLRGYKGFVQLTACKRSAACGWHVTVNRPYIGRASWHRDNARHLRSRCPFQPYPRPKPWVTCSQPLQGCITTD